MRGPTGLCQLAGRLVMAMIDVFRTLSCRGEGREVSALFAFRPGLLDATRGEKRGGWRDWVGLVLRGAEAFGGRIGPGDLGFAAWFSEGCLTISSEERETWTAASLRGFRVLRPSGVETGKSEETS